VANLLLEHGATVNTHTGRFDCALQAAPKRGSLEIVKLLMEHGADVNSSGGKYGTPLQAACCDDTMRRTSIKDGTAIVELLLDAGADVNARGGKYHAALQAAAYHHRKFVDVLLKHGADPNIRGGKYGSAMGAARKKGFHRVMRLLREKGVDEPVEEDVDAKWVYGD
ncbi:ankyrin, partial [Lentithecium fluviatile CBS 122367]